MVGNKSFVYWWRVVVLLFPIGIFFLLIGIISLIFSSVGNIPDVSQWRWNEIWYIHTSTCIIVLLFLQSALLQDVLGWWVESKANPYYVTASGMIQGSMYLYRFKSKSFKRVLLLHKDNVLRFSEILLLLLQL